MNITSFTFNPFQENTYVVYDKSKECIIIDPGCHNEQEEEELRGFINKKELTPVKLINTHCHIDHILGNQFCSEKWNLELYMHKLDIPLLEKSGEIGKMYGFEEFKGSPFHKHFLNEKDKKFEDIIRKLELYKLDHKIHWYILCFIIFYDILVITKKI